MYSVEIDCMFSTGNLTFTKEAQSESILASIAFRASQLMGLLLYKCSKPFL